MHVPLSGFTNQDLKDQFKICMMHHSFLYRGWTVKFDLKQDFSLKGYITIDNKEIHIYKHIYNYKVFEQ